MRSFEVTAVVAAAGVAFGAGEAEAATTDFGAEGVVATALVDPGSLLAQPLIASAAPMMIAETYGNFIFALLIGASDNRIAVCVERLQVFHFFCPYL